MREWGCVSKRERESSVRVYLCVWKSKLKSPSVISLSHINFWNLPLCLFSIVSFFSLTHTHSLSLSLTYNDRSKIRCYSADDYDLCMHLNVWECVYVIGCEWVSESFLTCSSSSSSSLSAKQNRPPNWHAMEKYFTFDNNDIRHHHNHHSTSTSSSSNVQYQNMRLPKAAEILNF